MLGLGCKPIPMQTIRLQSLFRFALSPLGEPGPSVLVHRCLRAPWRRAPDDFCSCLKQPRDTATRRAGGSSQAAHSPAECESLPAAPTAAERAVATAHLPTPASCRSPGLSFLTLSSPKPQCPEKQSKDDFAVAAHSELSTPAPTLIRSLSLQ